VINFTKKEEKKIPEVNIGLVGHVDHGKTSLTQALTGKWADTHSEELKRGITIRLGYADATFYYCKKCDAYCATKKCQKCFGDCEPARAVSFVDAPGHEALMATVLSGASLMDGAILVIAADEKCPQLQTAEHLKALDVVGIRKIVIVQNKIDLASEEEAIKHYNDIKNFVKGTVAENAPIIPMSAVHNSNIDLLLRAIEETIPTPERDLNKDPKFYIARSFDINKPGTDVSDLKGGIVGGSLTEGKIKLNDEIEIVPGTKIGEEWTSLKTKVTGIVQAGMQLKEATPGGLVALQTELDPALTRGDGLSGNLAGYTGKLPAPAYKIKFKVNLFDYVIGAAGHQKVEHIKTNEILMLTLGIAKTVGVVLSGGETVETKLKIPLCVEKGDKLAISKQVGSRWHLIGWGSIIL